MRVGAVFGERTHLHWNESLDDIFHLHQTIYQIPSQEFVKNRSRLMDLFDLGSLMNRQPEHLTGGEKIRVNLALSMLHAPDVLYLDVPMAQNPYTQRMLREGIRAINEEWNVAILFSTQVIDDIAPLCSRMLLLDEGALLYDGGYERFMMQYQMGFLVAMEFDAAPHWREHHRFSLVHAAEGKWIVRVAPELSRKDAFLALSHLYNPLSIALCEQRIDHIVDKMRKGLKAYGSRMEGV
jgi:ABC-2 type transport system ATP-binding protein